MNLWSYTGIQINVLSVSPKSEYILSENWNISCGQMDAANNNIFRQYGIGYNNETGEILSCAYFAMSGENHTWANCSRSGNITTYEFAIPWSDIGPWNESFNPKSGKQIGFSISINDATAENNFRNITLRDGGGIIGINDLSKIPVITLG